MLEPPGSSGSMVMLMGNYKPWILVGAVLILSLLLGACAPAPTTTPAPSSTDEKPSVPSSPAPSSTEEEPLVPSSLPPSPTITTDEFEQTVKCHFGFMPASWDFEGAHEAGGAYDRPFFELFQWGMIESEAGLFDFFETDKYVRDAQAHGFHILANIQPFAHWDQMKCHQDLSPVGKPGDPKFYHTKGKPCDMEEYKNFVIKLVERYDGDGVQDMPGLTIPIKHWEVLNEPEFQEEPLVFFQGSSADYFDIANMHSIGHGEHLNIPSFKRFLAENGIGNKPIWITEVQYQQAHQTQDYSTEDFAKILARSYIFALANGVEKLFYVNIKLPPVRHGVPFDERSALFKDNGDKSPLFYAHLTVASMLGELSEGDTVETIREKIGGWSIDEGQYRFNIKGKIVYALWGVGPLPPEITGKVKVTEISGAQRVAESATLKLSDSPIFIEID